MLKGISPIISPELLMILDKMGHGDEIVFSDGNFPGESIGRIVLRADPRNLRALHVYAKCGFREYDRTEKDVYMELVPAR